MLVVCARLAPFASAAETQQVVSFVPMDTIFTKEDATLLAHQWRHMQI
jgi:hypothetical protein